MGALRMRACVCVPTEGALCAHHAFTSAAPLPAPPQVPTMPDFSGWSARIKVPHLFFMINYVQVTMASGPQAGEGGERGMFR